MFHSVLCDNNSLPVFFNNYYDYIEAPVDGMWDSFSRNGQLYLLKNNKEDLGYFVLNENNQLIRLFLQEQQTNSYSVALKWLIEHHKVDTAYVGNNESLFYKAVSEIAVENHEDTALFKCGDFQSMKRPDSVRTYNFRNAFHKDLDQAVSFLMNNHDIPSKEWLTGYFKERIDAFELYLLLDDKTIVGTCEVRISPSQPGYADVGMAVSKTLRNKGIGSYLIDQAKSIALDFELSPICSTEYSNTGSFKALQKAGFVPYHSLYKFNF